MNEIDEINEIEIYHNRYDNAIKLEGFKLNIPLPFSFKKITPITHHIDGNHLNNSIENLLMCYNNKEHANIHSQLLSLSYQLIRHNIIKFDKKKRKYYFLLE